MKIKVICNPEADSGRAKEAGWTAKQYFEENRANYSFDFTYLKGGATLISKKALELGFDTFVVIGGDGTVNEVLNGIGTKAGLNLGIIPAGFSNDFAKSIKLPTDIPSACSLILSKEPKVIDLLKVNDQYFLNKLSIGLDAMVESRMKEKAMKKCPGKGSLFRKIFLSRLAYKINIKADCFAGDVFCSSLTISNGLVSNKQLDLSQEQLNDGLINLLLTKKMLKRDMFRHLRYLYKCNYLTIPNNDILKVRNAKLELSDDLKVMVDGEPGDFGTSLDIEILPSHINMFLV